MVADKRELEMLHGRLTALEALAVMVLSQRGPDALRKAIHDLDVRISVMPGDTKEYRALKARLESALASVEEGTGN